jgi:hypothetical protein
MPVLHRFTHLLHDAEGRRYVAVIHGREADSGLWEGWIEFVGLDGEEDRLRTATETTQPDRHAVEYWASGLEPLYLEGAFSRAVRANVEQTAL